MSLHYLHKNKSFTIYVYIAKRACSYIQKEIKITLAINLGPCRDALFILCHTFDRESFVARQGKSRGDWRYENERCICYV